MRLPAYLRTAAGFVGCAGWLVAAAQAEPVGGASNELALSATTTSSPPLARALPREARDWRQLLGTVPQLAPYAGEFGVFPASAAKTALERGGRTRETVTTWTFVAGPFEWKPNAGKTFWVVTGAAGPRVVIAIFEAGETPRHVASAVLLEPEPALAIGWSASEPTRLLWTTCYGCQGLGGSIDSSGDGRVAFVYR